MNSKHTKEQETVLEEWYGGDPSDNGCASMCLINKPTDIKRLLIDSMDSFDQSKWDFLKSMHKD